MSIKLSIKNEETGTAKAAIVVFSDHATPCVLKPGEDVIIQAYQGRTISIVESEEDYSHGEVDDLQTGTVVNQDGISWLIAQLERAANCVVSPVDMPLEFSPKEGE